MRSLDDLDREICRRRDTDARRIMNMRDAVERDLLRQKTRWCAYCLRHAASLHFKYPGRR